MEHRFQHNNVQLETYIPLTVVCNRLSEPLTYITFSADRHALLDIGIGMNSGTVSVVTLVLCKKYSLHQGKMVLPLDKQRMDEIRFGQAKRQFCDAFDVDVYEDGVKITLSHEETACYYNADRIFLGCNDQRMITEIYLSDLCPAEMEHFMTEVRYAKRSARKSFWKRVFKGKR